MPDNRVSADLSEADRQAMLATIESIRQKLARHNPRAFYSKNHA